MNHFMFGFVFGVLLNELYNHFYYYIKRIFNKMLRIIFNRW